MLEDLEAKYGNIGQVEIVKHDFIYLVASDGRYINIIAKAQYYFARKMFSNSYGSYDGYLLHDFNIFNHYRNWIGDHDQTYINFYK